MATVIDLASRRVVGWAVAGHLRTDLVDAALTDAIARRRPASGLVFHSDRGCQYTSDQHARLAAAHGIRLSVGRRGQCWDNAVAESFFATIKTELLHRQPWPTHQDARQAIFEYIEGWYNTRRRHSTLGYLSPAAFEASRSHPLPVNHAASMRSTHRPCPVKTGQAQFDCFTARADALFDLVDGLCTPITVGGVAYVSLAPGARRGHGAGYAAVAAGRIDTNMLHDVLAAARPQ